MEHIVTIGFRVYFLICLLSMTKSSGLPSNSGSAMSGETTPGSGGVTTPPIPPIPTTDVRVTAPSSPPLPTTDGRVTAPPSPQTSPTDYFYYDYNSDYMENFKLSSDFCYQKNQCIPDVDESYPVKNCYCDSLCVTMGDCCNGDSGRARLETPPRSQFSCSVINEIMTHYGVYVIKKCAQDWSDDVTKSLCEDRHTTDDILLQLPVSENKTTVLYRNMYCAFCNYQYDIVYWRPQIQCHNVTTDDIVSDDASLLDQDDCKIQFLSPNPTMTYRLCPTKSIINDCSDDHDDSPVSLRNMCKNGDFSLVYFNGYIYRNEHCAVCDGLSRDSLLCEPLEPTISATPDQGPRKSYSFRLLVDFNSVSGNMKDNNDEATVDFSTRCHDDEMFDPFANKCRKIICVPPRTAVGGKCVAGEQSYAVKTAFHLPRSNITITNSSGEENCTYVRMEADEFEFRNNTQIFVFSSRQLYEVPDYFISGSDVFICSEQIPVCGSCSRDAMFQFDKAEGYVSLVGLCLSIVGLFINLCVYICFPQLRNTPGKILMCLIVSLLFAQLLFLISPLMENHEGACAVFAVLVHYFFMAAFCWMNVVALDLWVTFSKQFISSGSSGKSQKRLWYYSVYGWLIPLAIVAISVAVDSLQLEPQFHDIQPRYGHGVCWMTSRYGIVIFFACPLAVFKLFDCIAFVSTARHIYIANKHGAMARQNQNNCTFFINLKLSLVMGLTWVFAFVANAVGSSVLWYLFIIFNSLQGVFICLSFICTKRVLRLLSSKLRHVSSYLTRTRTVEISTKSGKPDSIGTQLTTLSSDKKL